MKLPAHAAPVRCRLTDLEPFQCIYVYKSRARFIPFANLVPSEVIEKCGNEIHQVIPLHHLRNVTLSFLRPHFH
jgi:hypothetical protein